MLKTIDTIPVSKIHRASKLVQTGAKVGVNYLKYYGDKLITTEVNAKERLNKNNAEDIYDGLKKLKGSALKDAHHTSAKYERSISEFEVTNLETDYKDNFYAPFVKDCPIQLAMKYVEEYEIKANNTKLIIGEIQGLYIKDNLLQKDGFINLADGNIAAINGLDGYSIPTFKERLDYQRPKIF